MVLALDILKHVCMCTLYVPRSTQHRPTQHRPTQHQFVGVCLHAWLVWNIPSL